MLRWVLQADSVFERMGGWPEQDGTEEGFRKLFWNLFRRILKYFFTLTTRKFKKTNPRNLF